MPLTPSPAAGPRRRSMLAGTLSTLAPLGVLAALGTATGCSDDKDSSADSEQSARAGHRLRQEAARQSRALLERYEATAAAHTVLADRLRPLRAATARHMKVLGGEDGGSKRSGKHTHDSKSHDGKSKDEGKSPVPDDKKAALTALGEAERRTAEKRSAALVTAPPELARLLASLAAAGAAHAYLLGADDGEEKDG